jgi:hypothetical protein
MGGAVLTVAQMSPAQRELFLARAIERNQRRFPLLEVNDWAQGNLSLKGTSMLRVREQRSGTVSWRQEPVAQPGAAQAQAVPSTDAASVKRFPVTHLEMQLQYGPESRDAESLVVAPAP